jgi:hypothetical protein
VEVRPGRVRARYLIGADIVLAGDLPAPKRALAQKDKPGGGA